MRFFEMLKHVSFPDKFVQKKDPFDPTRPDDPIGITPNGMNIHFDDGFLDERDIDTFLKIVHGLNHNNLYDLSIYFINSISKQALSIISHDYEDQIRQCINLVQNLSTNANKILQIIEEMLDHSGPNGYEEASFFDALRDAAESVTSSNKEFLTASCAVNSANVSSNPTKMIQHFYNVARLYHSTTDVKNKINWNRTDKASIMALLDYLSEIGEDIVIHRNNQFTLNLPQGFKFHSAKTPVELIDKIMQNNQVLNYLQRLYAVSQS